jgi:hypothetical protein
MKNTYPTKIELPPINDPVLEEVKKTEKKDKKKVEDE